MNPKYSEFIVPFFSSSDVIFVPLYQMLAINMFCTCFQGKCIIIFWLLRLKESGQVSDSAVGGSLNKLFC